MASFRPPFFFVWTHEQMTPGTSLKDAMKNREANAHGYGFPISVVSAVTAILLRTGRAGKG